MKHPDKLESYIYKYLLRTMEQARSDLVDFDKLMDLLSVEKRIEIMAWATALKELIIERIEKKYAEVDDYNNSEFN